MISTAARVVASIFTTPPSAGATGIEGPKAFRAHTSIVTPRAMAAGIQLGRNASFERTNCRTRCWPDRLISRPINPQDSAPKKADMKETPQAGLGWPRNVTNPSTHWKNQASTDHSG
ncbi:MAG: hypothetical protein U1F77_02450 [Kiritimatiellia bacterium]